MASEFQILDVRIPDYVKPEPLDPETARLAAKLERRVLEAIALTPDKSLLEIISEFAIEEGLM